MSGPDSVLLAQEVTDFYAHRGAVFALALAAIEDYRREQRARQAYPPSEVEPEDAGRHGKRMLDGTWYGRGHVTPRAWARMAGLIP
jgi:hypothetical protein